MRHNVIEYATINKLPSMRPNRWDGRGVKAVLREATDAGRWGCAREQSEFLRGERKSACRDVFYLAGCFMRSNRGCRTPSY